MSLACKLAEQRLGPHSPAGCFNRTWLFPWIISISLLFLLEWDDCSWWERPRRRMNSPMGNLNRLHSWILWTPQKSHLTVYTNPAPGWHDSYPNPTQVPLLKDHLKSNLYFSIIISCLLALGRCRDLTLLGGQQRTQLCLISKPLAKSGDRFWQDRGPHNTTSLGATCWGHWLTFPTCTEDPCSLRKPVGFA